MAWLTEVSGASASKAGMLFWSGAALGVSPPERKQGASILPALGAPWRCPWALCPGACSSRREGWLRCLLAEPWWPLWGQGLCREGGVQEAERRGSVLEGGDRGAVSCSAPPPPAPYRWHFSWLRGLALLKLEHSVNANSRLLTLSVCVCG